MDYQVALRKQNHFINRCCNFRRDRADVFRYQGLLLYQQGKSSEAVALRQRAIQINPNIPFFYNNLGVVLRGQGNLSEAIQSFTRALHLAPKYQDEPRKLEDGA